MENPLISVQINCHNGGQFLHKAISSVYLQTYKNWEIIFWDNASSDQSVKIARLFDQKVKFKKKNDYVHIDQPSRKLLANQISKYVCLFLNFGLTESKLRNFLILIPILLS